MSEELLSRETYVACDLPQQNGRNVASLVKWNRGAPTIWMAILPVRTALPHLGKPQSFKDCGHLSRAQDRQLR